MHVKTYTRRGRADIYFGPRSIAERHIYALGYEWRPYNAGDSLRLPTGWHGIAHNLRSGWSIIGRMADDDMEIMSISKTGTDARFIGWFTMDGLRLN